MIKQKYIHKFKPFATIQFNTNFKGKMKLKLMSFYNYLITICKKKKQNRITISKEDIATLWNKKQKRKANAEGKEYKKINPTTVLRWLLKLENAQLLIVNREIADTNIYILNEDGSLCTKKCTKKCTDKNSIETIDTTEIQKIENEHKYINTKSFINDLDSNSNTTKGTQDNFNKEKYIANQEKVDNWEYMDGLLQKAFKALKIKSMYIKNTVISKVYGYYRNVTKKHAMKYICNCILNAKDQSDYNYKKHVLGNTYTTIDSFNNYEQRSYDGSDGGLTYSQLEKKLLGWE